VAIDFVTASLVLLPQEERHRHEIGGFALGRISATVVASQVGAGVEQPGVKGAMPVAAA
jgi:hypothetical protein